jgi:hypothetical protein
MQARVFDARYPVELPDIAELRAVIEFGVMW